MDLNNNAELSGSIQNILQSEFGSENFQFKDISRGGQAFIFEVRFSDQHHVLRICSSKTTNHQQLQDSKVSGRSRPLTRTNSI